MILSGKTREVKLPKLIGFEENGKRTRTTKQRERQIEKRDKER